ncbi:MAG: hypothetical protein AAGG50_22235 [Bacteroidota bacterium]
MEADVIAGRIYSEMGLAPPEVIQFPSLSVAIDHFPEWKPRVGGVSNVYWEYQYPVLHPESYWAQFHLFDADFQFDLTRNHNARGCYTDPKFHSQIPIEPKYLYGRYLRAAISASCRHKENDADLAISNAIDRHEHFFEALFDMLDQEEPTSQLTPWDFVFLAPQSWLTAEFEILRDMRDWIQMPVCEEHYQNVKLLNSFDGVLLTFSDLVVATRFDDADEGYSCIQWR